MTIPTLLRWVVTCTLIMTTSLVSAADAKASGDPEAGKNRSAVCLGCHGLNGEGKEAANGQPAFPRLSGQLQSYLKKSMHDYKNDSRKDPMMGAIAKGLSDVDMENLAAFYANLK